MLTQSLKLLFIEDDKNNAIIVSQCLRMHGYKIIIANNIEQAWNEFIKNENAIDGIILDIILEIGDTKNHIELCEINDIKTSGILLYQLIRKRKPNLPILIRTGELTKELKACFKNEKKVILSQKGVSQNIVEIANSFFINHTDSNRNIFIVHGHDNSAKYELKNYVQNVLKICEPIILHEKPSLCRTIFEKFEHYTNNIDVVFVLLTPDDEVIISPGTSIYRARQNVILELGYFLGKFDQNREKIIVLYNNVEIPTDIKGIIYIDISQGIESAGENIRKELEMILN